VGTNNAAMKSGYRSLQTDDGSKGGKTRGVANEIPMGPTPLELAKKVSLCGVVLCYCVIVVLCG
jgi:hypothetical protein